MLILCHPGCMAAVHWVAPGGGDWVENASKDSMTIRHRRGNLFVQVMHLFQGGSPSPAGIVTRTIAHFFEVVLNVKFPLFNLYTG